MLRPIRSTILVSFVLFAAGIFTITLCDASYIAPCHGQSTQGGTGSVQTEDESTSPPDPQSSNSGSDASTQLESDDESTAGAPSESADASTDIVDSEADGDSKGGGEPQEEEEEEASTALIQNDAVVFGILIAILGLVFWTNGSDIKAFKVFYKVVPMLLLCYFLPSLLTLTGLVDPEHSNLYFVATRYLLPASLVLLTLSIDLKEIARLGPKALIMFLTGSVGVIAGGPIAILIVSQFAPDLVGGQGPDAVWRGLTTVAGSWIGGGANQAAMKEMFGPSDPLYSAMVAVDVLVAEFWMVFLIIGVGHADRIDRLFRADSSSVTVLQQKMEDFTRKTARIPTTNELMVILAIVFGAVGFGHLVADYVAPLIAEKAPDLKKFSLDSEFFWLIMITTTIGVALSFTRARKLEGAGASKVGTIFIFVLVATIGMSMDLRAVVEHPGYFLVGLIWILFHIGLLFIVGIIIRAPYFFLAVGSKANIGGAASAPVVAATFHPSLAPVGVLLAVLGYALGTYGAYICGLIMQEVAP